MSEIGRRARQTAPRPKVVQFSLSEEEFADVSSAAEPLALARGVRGRSRAGGGQEPGIAGVSPLRDALAELITAAGLVRWAGTNLSHACRPAQRDRAARRGSGVGGGIPSPGDPAPGRCGGAGTAGRSVTEQGLFR